MFTFFWEIIKYFLYIIGLGLIFFKIYYKVLTGTYKNEKRLDGQVIIVTGSNTGIGKATAFDFARRGAKVIMACRDLNKANSTRDEIIRMTGNKNVVVRHLDLTSLSSVRKFAKEINSTENRLDVLVNNAGSGGNNRIRSEDGLLLQLQINHYGPFLLTYLLIDLLKKSAPSRIINVSSVMHKYGKIDFDKMNSEKHFNMTKAYADSKLYNVICSKEFARRLKGTGVTSNSLHPGGVNTDIFRRLPFVARMIVGWSMWLFFKTPEEGAQTTIYLAVSDEVTNVSGKYFADCKEATPLNIVENSEITRQFFDKCCDLVDLKPEERII